MNRNRPLTNDSSSSSSSASQLPRTSTSSSSSSKTPSLIERLSILEGGNSAFRHQLKVLLVEINIISDWIEEQFGVSLINKDSEIYKCMNNYDDELGDLTKELSLAAVTTKGTGTGGDNEEEDTNTEEEESFPANIKIEHEMVGDEEDDYDDEIDDGGSMISLTKDDEDEETDCDHHAARRPPGQPRPSSAISPPRHRRPGPASRRGLPMPIGSTKTPTQSTSMKTNSKTNTNSIRTELPHSLPLILDGTYFTVQNIVSTSNKINARCNLCTTTTSSSSSSTGTEEQPKFISGSATSTSNYLTHLKRLHPEALAGYEKKKQERGPIKKIRKKGILPGAAVAT